ncbi:glycoside hydrolase family 5 protein [Micromonospora inyonensis]|uniref:cellulase n=1 Tax=Micromonospora inyonensis TaxID=47866 RepID=A0A1C6SQD3_9ACTN|nr:cellulase family glycosylhydrolase [Micromonospora inyonensis]SCL31728.1 Cellulase (glycosyl hydrolase family 5) [Micromonospora inyonensis]
MSRTLRRGTLGGVLAAVVTATVGVLVAAAPTPAPAVAASAGTGTGYLHTDGNRIVDGTGTTVRITGINWFGMETDNKTFHGLWSTNPWRNQIDTMARLGYNTLRVPYSNDALKPGATASDPSNDEDCGWWGGNLSKAGAFPVRLTVANRLVYSPHEYATSVYEQDWFEAPDFPANLPGIWDRYWGYLYKQNIAPIMMGEFGSTLADPRDKVWLERLMAYTGSGVNGMSFTYWSWNPNSGDTGGIALDDWTTINTTKQAILQPYLIAPVGGGLSPRRPAGRRPRLRVVAARSPTGRPIPGRAVSRVR